MTEEGTERIPYVTDRGQVSADQQAQFDDIAASRGRVAGPFSVLIHSPATAGRVADLGAYLRFESALPDAVRELAILTVARECECAYEWVAHEALAREAGVSDAAIAAIDEDRSLTALVGPESLVPTAVRELLRTDALSDETFARLRDEFSIPALVELVATVGYYVLLACVLNAFAVSPGEPSTPA